MVGKRGQAQSLLFPPPLTPFPNCPSAPAGETGPGSTSAKPTPWLSDTIPSDWTVRPEGLGLGAERDIGQHLDPARNGLSAADLPSRDLVQDVVGELLREGMGGVVFADIRNGLVEAQGFTVTLSASQRANASSPSITVNSITVTLYHLHQFQLAWVMPLRRRPTALAWK